MPQLPQRLIKRPRTAPRQNCLPLNTYGLRTGDHSTDPARQAYKVRHSPLEEEFIAEAKDIQYQNRLAEGARIAAERRRHNFLALIPMLMKLGWRKWDGSVISHPDDSQGINLISVRMKKIHPEPILSREAGSLNFASFYSGAPVRIRT